MNNSPLSFVEHIQHTALMWMLKAMARVPLRLLYVLSDLIYFVVYKCMGYRKKVVMKNLELCFPDLDKSERRKIMNRFYHHFADIVVETVKWLHISDAEIDRRVEVVGAELIDNAARNGKSSILFLGHFGNWEWVTAITRHFRCKQIFAEIYSPLKSKVMDAVMLELRNRFHSEAIPKQRAARRLIEIERKGEHFVTGFIADQRPLGRNLHHWTRFMGIETPYLVGGEAIGDKLGCEFFYLDIEKKKRGYYRLTFRRLLPLQDDEPNPVTRSFLTELEKSIRRRPELWLWTHNRFKASIEKFKL